MQNMNEEKSLEVKFLTKVEFYLKLKDFLKKMLLRRVLNFGQSSVKSSVSKCFSQEEKKGVLLFGSVGKSD